MKISVIVCTYNRCQQLRGVLEDLACSEVPPEVYWEVLVVDNNSADKTSETVREVAMLHPDRFRYIAERKQGKSWALNTGIRESQGEVLAFVDDDVKVERAWLWNLCRPLEGVEWAGAGGRTLPEESVTLPGWLTLGGPHSLGGVLAAMFDLGDQPRELDRAPYGANMAYRREMFEKYGLFRTDMGPSADQNVPRPNEDTEFGRRVMAAGERLFYEPAAVVHHPILPDRVRKEYFLAWWYDYGRASIREVGRRPDICGIQRRYWTIAKICVACLMPTAARWLLSVEPSKRFFHKCWMWSIFGQIAEAWRAWGARPAEQSASRGEMESV